MNARQRRGFEQWYNKMRKTPLANPDWGTARVTWDAACQDEAEAVKGLVADAVRAIEAWDSTVLPRGYDGMMQERMECLRAALKAWKGE